MLFVNPPICLLVLAATFWLIPGERRAARLAGFDALGTVLGAGGMLLLVYTLVNPPAQGWGSARTIGDLAVVCALLAAFVLNDQRSKHPLIRLPIFKIHGLAAANITQLIGVGGFVTMFFFLTLYMQTVLGYSPLQTGASYLPLTVGVGISAGIATQLIGRIGTRPVIVAGALVTAAGLYWLSRIPVHGSYLTKLLPGVAIFSAIATSYTNQLLAGHHAPNSADRRLPPGAARGDHLPARRADRPAHQQRPQPKPRTPT